MPNAADHLVQASNSLFLKRFRERNGTPNYKGWNECIVTANILETDSMDAIVIKLPVGVISLEYLMDWQIRQLQSLLNDKVEIGWGKLPVIILKETKGMNVQDCQIYWAGEQCSRGYRKEFFAQTFSFADGSRLYIDKSNGEVFYSKAPAR
jgi:hypothetical protein